MMRTRPSANSSACYASGRTVIEPPRRAAQAFADHLNYVLNRTISDSRLSLVELPRTPGVFELARRVGQASAPLELHGTPARLFVRQVIEVVGGHCQVESYSYRLQRDDSRESWLLRWEYFREPPRADYPYAPAHVHLNGNFADGQPAERLHTPTRRVPLELVAWHLIAEWGVRSKIAAWRQLLVESIEGFDERRTAH